MSSEIPDNVKEALKSIGLTDYEISIYLTLISKGPMDARELSEASGVPYSRIYNILTQLEKDKLWIIKEEESRPFKVHVREDQSHGHHHKPEHHENRNDLLLQIDQIGHEQDIQHHCGQTAEQDEVPGWALRVEDESEHFTCVMDAVDESPEDHSNERDTHKQDQ